MVLVEHGGHLHPWAVLEEPEGRLHFHELPEERVRGLTLHEPTGGIERRISGDMGVGAERAFFVPTTERFVERGRNEFPTDPSSPKLGEVGELLEMGAIVDLEHMNEADDLGCLELLVRHLRYPSKAWQRCAFARRRRGRPADRVEVVDQECVRQFLDLFDCGLVFYPSRR